MRALGFPRAPRPPPRHPRPARVAAEDLDRALAREAEIAAAIRAAGYAHAVIDREPFRSGRLNAVLRQRA